MTIYHILNHKFHYETEKLIRVFYPDIKILNSDTIVDGFDYIQTDVRYGDEFVSIYTKLHINDFQKSKSDSIEYIDAEEDEFNLLVERVLCTNLFYLLQEFSSYTPPWGLLTGIRPSKLFIKLKNQYGLKEAERQFIQDFLVSDDKVNLTKIVASNEEEIIQKSDNNSYSLYVSIPFCPSRCSYCSFVSHSVQQAKSLVPQYISKLCEELKLIAEIAKAKNLNLKSIYIGGGTPTTLSEKEFELLLGTINNSFDLSKCSEYTVEAGRPDTITSDKLDILKSFGVNRISINPQTFSDKVLGNIGRRHSAEQIYQAYEIASSKNFNCINMDLIAGLPGDSHNSFLNSVKCCIDLNPQNITVHTLSIKRSSRLFDNYNFEAVQQQTNLMLDNCYYLLEKSGYIPYYMYRQSKTIGNLENTGWAKVGFECEYNIQMMEETHSVFAAGAGAVSKVNHQGRIDRIFNFKYPYEYISQFDEMLKRKEKIKDILI